MVCLILDGRWLASQLALTVPWHLDSYQQTAVMPKVVQGPLGCHSMGLQIDSGQSDTLSHIPIQCQLPMLCSVMPSRIV